jgi:transcriptional regulator with XRE-family HTH domain
MSDFFSTRLKALRGDRNKAAFSRFLGIPAPMYHRYELGQVPKKDNLRVIAEKCGVTIDWLLGEGEASESLPISPHATPCRYPEACDLEREFSQVRDELTSVDARLSAMTAQLETVTRLLGAALGNGLSHPKEQRHRAAG